MNSYTTSIRRRSFFYFFSNISAINSITSSLQTWTQSMNERLFVFLVCPRGHTGRYNGGGGLASKSIESKYLSIIKRERKLAMVMLQPGAAYTINVSPLPSIELFMPWDLREIYLLYSPVLSTLYSIVVVVLYIHCIALSAFLILSEELINQTPFCRYLHRITISLFLSFYLFLLLWVTFLYCFYY